MIACARLVRDPVGTRSLATRAYYHCRKGMNYPPRVSRCQIIAAHELKKAGIAAKHRHDAKISFYADATVPLAVDDQPRT